MTETNQTGTSTNITYTYNIIDTKDTNVNIFDTDVLSCLDFLKDDSECLETLESMRKEMEDIRDNKTTFYFESDNGTEPGSKYQEACQKIINFIEDLEEYIRTAYSNLKNGITNINNELEGCFSWTRIRCEKKAIENESGE